VRTFILGYVNLSVMKEQLKTALLPPLPIVGSLRLSTIDGNTLSSAEVVISRSHDKLDPFFDSCFSELHTFLTGKSKKINIQVDPSILTPFQFKVLEEMKKIPYGEVMTYGELAHKINSRAYQAVGAACGKNPYLLIYPCHRVVGANNLGGFAHGLEMKRNLLHLESLKFQDFSFQ
jgi:O-6-methylguanine DNA methyltransferase